MRPAHRRQRILGRGTVRGEHRGDPFALCGIERQCLARPEPFHLRSQRRGVATVRLEQQAFEIGADLDIHRRSDRRVALAHRIVAVADRAGEDVVLVGGDDQPLHRQAHLCRDIASKDIAEIPGRHAEGHLAVGRAKLQRGGEIIHHLRHEPRPVDRIDRADIERGGQRRVREHALHHRLRIVEAAGNRDIVDIGRAHRGHLAALDLAHPAFGMEHEDLHALAPGDRMDRRGARIAASRPDDRQRALALLQKPLEQQPEQLQCHILERKRRPVEQFEQPVLLVELNQRSDSRMIERLVGLYAEIAQLVFGKALSHEGCHDPHSEFGIGKPAQRGDLVAREVRPLLRQVEAPSLASPVSVTPSKSSTGAPPRVDM